MSSPRIGVAVRAPGTAPGRRRRVAEARAPRLQWGGMREYRYRIDGEGRIFHDGSEILDPMVLRFFLRAMQPTPDGRYLVVCQGEHNWFEPEDTPFVVQRLRLARQRDRVSTVELGFAGDYREPLDPGSLEAEGGRLFCRVRRGAFRARFGRVAMHQLAPLLVEDAAGLGLVLDGTRHPVRQPIGVTG